MAVYAGEKDYEYLKKLNNAENIKIYKPGTTLLQGDVALGGKAAYNGISDQYLGGGTRVYGEDAAGTANQYYKYLADQAKQTNATQASQYQTDLAQARAEQKPAENLNTMDALIGNDPEARAYYDQAMQAAKLGSRNAMETMNARGILNSSITGDAVTGLEQQAVTGVLPQLFQMQNQRKEADRQDAYNRMNMLGYADNQAAKVLGIAVGTPSGQFSLQEAGLTGMYKGQRTAQQQAADQAAYQFEKQYGLSVGEAVGMINSQPTLARRAQEIQSEQYTASYQQNAQQFAQSQAQQQAQFNASLTASSGGGGGSSGGSSGSRSSGSRSSGSSGTTKAAQTAATKASNLAEYQAGIASDFNKGYSADDIIAKLKNNAYDIGNTPGVSVASLTNYVKKISGSATATQQANANQAGAGSAARWISGANYTGQSPQTYTSPWYEKAYDWITGG